MSLRPAAPADEPIMASICAAAWFEESLFGETMHPLRHKYPDDMKIYWRKRIQNEFRDPRTKLLVATVPEGDEEKIVGVSAWQRQGDDEGAKKVMSEWADIGMFRYASLPSERNAILSPYTLTNQHKAQTHSLLSHQPTIAPLTPNTPISSPPAIPSFSIIGNPLQTLSPDL